MTDTIKPQVVAALTEALGDALDCTREWSAWSVGTMSADDFAPVTGDPERLDEIAEAVLAPMRTALEASQTEISSLKQSLAEAEGQIRHLEQALARETNRRERAEEELECLHMTLDDRRVPRKVDDNQLSLVGRVDAYATVLRTQIQGGEQ